MGYQRNDAASNLRKRGNLTLTIGLLVDDVHPVAGPIRQPRHPIRFAVTPAGLGGPAPMLGQHTDEILTELGLGDRIADLRTARAVA